MVTGEWERLLGASVIVQIQVGVNICAWQEADIWTLSTYLSFWWTNIMFRREQPVCLAVVWSFPYWVVCPIMDLCITGCKAAFMSKGILILAAYICEFLICCDWPATTKALELGFGRGKSHIYHTGLRSSYCGVSCFSHPGPEGNPMVCTTQFLLIQVLLWYFDDNPEISPLEMFEASNLISTGLRLQV